jgi:hypothetical protein
MTHTQQVEDVKLNLPEKLTMLMNDFGFDEAHKAVVTSSIEMILTQQKEDLIEKVEGMKVDKYDERYVTSMGDYYGYLYNEAIDDVIAKIKGEV